jgi:hypothetical protein
LVLAELHATVAERMDLVDATLDSLDTDQAARRPNQALKALSEAAGIPLQLSKASLEALRDDPRTVATEVFDQIEAVLLQSAAAHLSVVLERLLGRRPAPDPAEPPLIDLQKLPGCAQAAVQAAFDARRKHLFGPKGELAHALEVAMPKLDGPLGEGRSLALLEIMGMTDDGRIVEEEQSPTDESQAMVDHPATPSLTAPVAPRLTYTYLADELLADTPLDEVAAQSLEHLLGAQQALKDDLSAETLNESYRHLLLASIDERWVEYLTHLEELRYEVRLEGMAHNDPLVVYKSKASGAYGALLVEVRRAAVSQMFHILSAARLVGTSEASSLEKATPRLTFLKLG